MADPTPDTPLNLGIYNRKVPRPRVTATEVIAAALSLIWLLGVAVFFLVTGSGGAQVDRLSFVMTLLAVFMPVALIWVAATAARTARVMREESARLQEALDAMRQTYVQQQMSGTATLKPAVERKLDEIAAAQRKTDSAIATFTSIRPEAEAAEQPAVPVSDPDPNAQPSLALGTPAEAIALPVNIPDFIRALNFPENAEDADGFRALRRALRDRQTARLVQASQDVLTLLSEDGIYMDDLRPDRARPEVWRRFAQGARGPAVAGLGGVRDRSCLALAAGRMRQDPVFRDAVHHFLRRFDETFVGFETVATDADIAELTDTRTARAFMLLGRVTGTFA
ncbi:MAG: hypothetical protein QNJ16_12750 [Rhodobacter sp.]|nr:hypothetical protein [Rhodobacter sp.]